ncbi:hypothetical protein [Bradyrhizobium sp. 199]|uniref:hypothetical protein n=1 Tax=Bradyrhizobium sp. 199 TaxID=2782664 RepID=UPI001FFA8C77|nr:hypothetical protein [Bradyrhizobium sp. 199]MCK1362196.1 hypothetical protein [Bradyrhizobium sp. 199]
MAAISAIDGSDFGGFNPAKDVLTLSNDQNGTSINLGDGNNTLNLEGPNGDGSTDGRDIQIHLTNNVGAITNGNFRFV